MDVIDNSGFAQLQTVCRKLASEHLIEVTADQLWNLILNDANHDWQRAREMLDAHECDSRCLRGLAASITGEPTEEIEPVVLYRPCPIAAFASFMVGIAVGGFGVLLLMSMARGS